MSAEAPLERARDNHLSDCRYRNLSPKTLAIYRQYECDFVTYLTDQAVTLSLGSLNLASVKACSAWIRTRNGGKRGGGHAARMFVSIMKTWSAWLSDNDQLPVDPLSRLKRPR